MDLATAYQSKAPNYFSMTKQLLGVYYALCSWAIDWGIHFIYYPTSRVSGFVLNDAELAAMRVDPSELLSTVTSSRNPTFTDGILAYEYYTAQGTIKSAVPGDFVDGAKIKRILFKPDPKSLPNFIFWNAFEYACRQIGRKPQDFCFSYHNVYFDDVQKLIRCITNREFDPYCLSQELMFARSKAEGELSGYIKGLPTDPHRSLLGPKASEMKDKDRILFIRENLLTITQDDLRMEGCRLSRKEVARILGYTAEAVRGWDRRKRAPGKVRWIPGTSIGKAVFYDIKQALPAMQQIFKRNANREHSRKMALLLYAQNKMK